MSPAPVFVRIPESHHPGIRLCLIPGFRDPGSVLILGQVTQYGNPYLICIALTGTKAKWTWSEEHHQAFEDLKTALTTPPVLGFPNASDLFILDTDASDLAIGAELNQLQNDKERVISYASRMLNNKQRRYCTTCKELLAAVVFTHHYAHFLLGRRFVIRTDHACLTWIMRFRQTGGQLSRWLEELARYNFVIQHRKVPNIQMLMVSHESSRTFATAT